MSRSVFRTVVVTIVLSYGLTVGVLVLRLTAGDLPIRYEILGALALATVMAVAPTLALLALRGRTTLFLPAALIAVAQSPILYFLAIVLLVAGFAWKWAYLKVGDRVGVLRTVATIVTVLLLWVGAAASLFVHIDPVCVEWLTDGTVRTVNAHEQGFTSGWVWVQPNTTSGGSTMPAEVVQSACSSDVQAPLEAGVILVLAAAAVFSGAGLIGRREETPPEASP